VPLSGDKWQASDWDTIVGPLGARDPHMIESIAERTAANIGMYGYKTGLTQYKGWSATTGADLSADPPSGNVVIQPSIGMTVPYNGNGGERHMVDLVVSSSDTSPSDGDFDDLQFACMGQRSTTAASIECTGNDSWAWNPACDCVGQDCAANAYANTNWGTAIASVTEPRFAAYPGLRYLRMINALGSSGYAASVCAPSFEPAVVGIVDKVKSSASMQCPQAPATINADGSANCILLETFPSPAPVYDAGACEGYGLCTPGAATCHRSPVGSFPVTESPAQAASAIAIAVASNAGTCATESATTYATSAGALNIVVAPATGVNSTLVCEVPQLTGSDLASCTTDPSFTTADTGWCDATNPAVIEAFGCAGMSGSLRYFGVAATPRAGSQLYMQCQ
jgi:hypothetical protein